jgi:hypothetical protein
MKLRNASNRAAKIRKGVPVAAPNPKKAGNRPEHMSSSNFVAHGSIRTQSRLFINSFRLVDDDDEVGGSAVDDAAPAAAVINNLPAASSSAAAPAVAAAAAPTETARPAVRVPRRRAQVNDQ